jgi:lambda family phage portal protein
MALIDTLLAGIAPGWALRRARARLALDQLSAMYEGAAINRRTRGWRADRRGPNAEVRPAMKLLRDRSRDLVRNNPFASAGLDLVVSYQVGAGIMPRSKTGDIDLDAQVDALWTAWADRADLSERTDLYGLQALLARGRCESGEALAQMIPLTATEARRRGTPVPLALQVIEADHLDETYDGGMRGAAPVIRQGIEFDPSGVRAVAYHIHRQHPAEIDSFFGPGGPIERIRIPADRMIHLFRQDRPGQIRGVPDLAPVMTRLRSLDELEDAALEQAKVQACLAALIVSQAGPSSGPLEGGAAGADEAAEDGVKSLYPGMMERLLPGEDVRYLQPTGAGGFNELARHQLHAIATGWGLTYDLLTGDLSGANYSSLRAGRLAFKRRLERLQWHVLVPAMCEPIWRAFIDAAVRVGALPMRPGGYPASWSPPVFEMVDPLKDALAIQKQMRLGLLTFGQAVGQMGHEPRRQAAEIAEWNEIMDDGGLILDGDPRRTGGSGGAQDARANAAIEIAATGAATDQPADDDQEDAADPAPAAAVHFDLSGGFGEAVRDALLPAVAEMRDAAGALRQVADVTRDVGDAVLTGAAASAELVANVAHIATTAADAAREANSLARDAVAQASRPRRMTVTRDAQGRVTGSEEV